MNKKINRLEISSEEEEHYVLSTVRDREILLKIHQLEDVFDLTDNERFLLTFIRTQLEPDWRSPVITLLDEMLKNKGSSKEERWKKLLKKADAVFWKPEKS